VAIDQIEDLHAAALDLGLNGTHARL
jgi:hypothetical protein